MEFNSFFFHSLCKVAIYIYRQRKLRLFIIAQNNKMQMNNTRIEIENGMECFVMLSYVRMCGVVCDV